jgi:drug/metabolite transporter (DMT)-like permease
MTANQHPSTKHPSKALVIAAFAAVYLIWGSTYLGIFYAIQTIPPFIMAGIRFTIAGSLLLAWCLIKGDRLPSLKSISIMGFGGVLMLFVGNSALAWVEQFIPTGLAAIIVATVPLWFIALDKRNWKFNFSNKLIITGLVVGFAGVAFLFAGKGSLDLTGDRSKLFAVIVLIVGTISWAIGSLYSKYKKVEGSTTIKAAFQMLAAGATALIAALPMQEYQGFSFSQVSSTSIWALVYLITMGSLVGYISYVWLLSVRPPSLVGTYAYVNPVVAVFLGWLIANETIGSREIIALLIVLAGVVLTTMAKSNQVAPDKQRAHVDLEEIETT